MPYSIRKNSDGSYRVVNWLTGKVRMKHGSKADAEGQVRLLHGVDNGMRQRRFGRR
jgi:hypothetical protein